MSIRSKKFSENILPLWEEIKKLIKRIETRGISSEDLQEVAHLRKISAYFSEMLDSIDPDFIPIGVLDNIILPLDNIKYYLNRYLYTADITYLKEINQDYLDTLLKDLMPFIFYKGKVNNALHEAINQYSKTISSSSENHLHDIRETVSQAESILEELQYMLHEFELEKEKMAKYIDEVFGIDGIKDRLLLLDSDFKDKNIEISNLYKEIFSPENGIKKQISLYLDDSAEKNKKINQIKDNSTEISINLKEFYTQIFGRMNNEGQLEGGLKNEIQMRKNELDKFKQQQQDRYIELNKQIESLLPGATSAGLSSSYNKMHEQFKRSVKYYGMLFYLSLVILLISVFMANFIDKPKDYYITNEYMIDTNISHLDDSNKDASSNEQMVFPKETDNIKLNVSRNDNPISHNLIYILNNIIYKVPFILPSFWLVIFISRRRNEAQRLEQEYAHKEALAKSYESYKQQIEKLDEKDKNELLPILMKNMLEAIALNPAKTLDRENKDPTPIEEVIKKKEFWEYIERIKNLLPNNKDK